MNNKDFERLGDELYGALRECRVVDPLSSRHPDMTVEHAYQVQQRMIARRMQDGERIVG